MNKIRRFKIKSIAFAFLFFFVTLGLHAQDILVSGTIFDDIGPLPNAGVTEKGGKAVTVADLDGKYKINVPKGSVLIFSFIGYDSKEVVVNSNVINVELNVGDAMLNETVVVGYGKMEVKDLTSAITTIRSNEIMKSTDGQVMQGLQGKVAGMQVVSNGAPGSSPIVRLRGVGSFNAASPLYVVDGMFYDNIDFLNNSDIASVSVLKDASASAIYGRRAANGVIMIETHSGSRESKATVRYDGYYGIQVPHVLKMANTEQYVHMVNSIGGDDVAYVQNAIAKYGRSRVNPNLPDVNTDWYKEVSRNAAIQNHAIDISGGGKDAVYSVGASFFEQDGVLDTKNNYKRMNLRSKIDYDAYKWLKVGVDFLWSNGEKYNGEQSVWRQAYYAVPTLPRYDNGNYANARDLSYITAMNPFITLENSDKRLKINKLLGNAYAQINFIPNKLIFKSTLSRSFEGLESRDVYFPYYVDEDVQRPQDKSSINRSMTNVYKTLWDNVLTYNESFGKHKLTLMGGTSYEEVSNSSLNGQGLDIPYRKEELWYIDQSKEKQKAGDNGYRLHDFSYFGRLSYSYDSKYLLYGTLRYEGTQKYQEKWALFPSVGAGWIVTEEDFMRDNQTINFLKLRLGWGRLGNNNIGTSAGSNVTKLSDLAIDDQRVTGSKSTSEFSYLKWEMIEDTNFGISANFFDYRLSAEIDYFIRKSRDVAMYVSYPIIPGGTTQNVGKIENRGLELALGWSDKIGANFRYSVSGNLATLRNRVTDLYTMPYIDHQNRQRSAVGHPIYSFYGYKVTGVYQTQEEIDNDPIAVANNLVPGDLRYADLDGNNVIDGDDRTYLGSHLPSITYGANINLGYRDFELGIAFYGVSGNKLYNMRRTEMQLSPHTNVDANLIKDAWNGPGTSNTNPSVARLRNTWNQKEAGFYIEDGAYFRIQNIQLAYSIKNKKVKNYQLPDMRVTFTADRPLTFTKYNGFTPEISNGLDNDPYPVSAVYTLGLNVKF